SSPLLSSRREATREATLINLRQAGFDTWQAVILKPDAMHVASAAEYKTPQRQAIEDAGYTIILNVGDQPSDLTGGYAERDILLPNPMYRIA
ncbi:MAG: acid phosphatase, partial [Rhodospirillaceae bacterium]|nr:acid phosphatase [Rhodospirillaceae bacterium]